MKQINREIEIEEFLKSLKKLWLKYPEQRFYQLLFNYTLLGTRNGAGYVRDPFHYQDIEIHKNIINSLTH